MRSVALQTQQWIPPRATALYPRNATAQTRAVPDGRDCQKYSLVMFIFVYFDVNTCTQQIVLLPRGSWLCLLFDAHKRKVLVVDIDQSGSTRQPTITADG